MANVVPTSLIINSAGSFLLGVAVELATIAYRRRVTRPRSNGMPLPVLLATGLCGGFTTIAAVTPESITIFESGDEGRAAIYALGHLLLANVALAIGQRVGRRLVRSDLG